MYDFQEHMRNHPQYRIPVGLVPTNTTVVSNKNNNNSGGGKPKQQETTSSNKTPSVDVPDNSKAAPSPQGRTNIFVWKQPNDTAEKPPTPTMSHRQVSTPTLAHASLPGDDRKVRSHTNLSEHSAVPAKLEPGKEAAVRMKTHHHQRSNSNIVDEEISASMNAMRMVPPHQRTYRSETPAPQTQTKADSRFGTPQMRRAKTPTPGQHKAQMRRKSSTTDEIPTRTHQPANDRNVPQAPPRRVRPKSMHVDAIDGGPSKSNTPTPSQQQPPHPAMPYPVPGWNNSMQQPNNYFNPGMYAAFVEMMKYYNTLSPEQKNMLNTGAATAAPVPHYPGMPSPNVAMVSP